LQLLQTKPTDINRGLNGHIIKNRVAGLTVHEDQRAANILLRRQTYKWAAGVHNRAVIQAFVLSFCSVPEVLWVMVCLKDVF